MGKQIKVLSVCGSGVMTSSMVAMKIKEMLGERGYDVTTVESSPMEVEGLIEREKFDFIAYSSPLPGEYDIPAISSFGLITGMGEEQFLQDVLEILSRKGK